MRIARNSKGHGGRTVEKVRFAVVGQGYFAQSAILPAFASARSCDLVAIVSDDDTKLRALRRRYRVEHALAYDQYDAFLASGAVDAVYIALPNDMHAEYTLRAARAGVHVLCEKPIAGTSADAERMIAGCARAGVKLMVAYRSLRLRPAYDVATDLVLEVEVSGKTRRRTFAKRDQVAPELDEFAASIREGRDPGPSGEEGLADMRVIEASIASAGRVRVNRVRPPRRPSLAQRRRAPAHRMPPLINVAPPSEH